jgi:3-phosphoinositide dependent protein kinase-1
MHVKLTDFGTSKILDGSNNGVRPIHPPSGSSSSNGMLTPNLPLLGRADSFVGTAFYVAPELLTSKETCKRFPTPRLPLSPPHPTT